MGFRRSVINWAVCDFCSFETHKDDTTRDLYIRDYIAHLKREHAIIGKEVIQDLEALLQPFSPYKVNV